MAEKKDEIQAISPYNLQEVGKLIKQAPLEASSFPNVDPYDLSKIIRPDLLALRSGGRKPKR